jgi:hypothetical protein
MTETPSLTEQKLTGKFRFKKNFLGSMVLYVQEKTTYYPSIFDESFKRESLSWRKANEFDITELTIKLALKK